MKQVARLDELIETVRSLANSQSRTLIVIDGFAKAGKSTIAQQLASLSRVEWTPIDLFMQGDEFDLKKIRKDLVKPFRKDGKVREVVPSLGGGRLQRGRPQSDIRVLIIEGAGASRLVKRIRADQLWWIDADLELRVDRSSGNSEVPGATRSSVHSMVEQGEDHSLREAALKITDVLVELGDTRNGDTSQTRSTGPALAETEAGMMMESTTDLLRSNGSGLVAASLVDDDLDALDSPDALDGSESLDGPDPLDGPDILDDLDPLDDFDSPVADWDLPSGSAPAGVAVAAFDTPIGPKGDSDDDAADDGPVELIPFDPGFKLPSQLEREAPAEDDALMGGGLMPGWLEDD